MSLNKTLTVLASGGGTNFQAIIDAISDSRISANINCLITDRDCFAETRAKNHNISVYRLPRKNNKQLNNEVMKTLCQQSDLIVLAGYLSILPNDFIATFSGKMINLHPSLLPKFGGAGMYGMNVHDAVIAASEKQTGCTTHYVETEIDTGEIIMQARVDIDNDDTAITIQKKVAVLEHDLLVNTIIKLLQKC